MTHNNHLIDKRLSKFSLSDTIATTQVIPTESAEIEAGFTLPQTGLLAMGLPFVSKTQTHEASR